MLGNHSGLSVLKELLPGWFIGAKSLGSLRLECCNSHVQTVWHHGRHVYLMSGSFAIFVVCKCHMPWYGCTIFFKSTDQIPKSHNAPVPYLTIHHFGTEMCTFLFQCCALWDMGQVGCGICEIGLFILSHKQIEIIEVWGSILCISEQGHHWFR